MYAATLHLKTAMYFNYFWGKWCMLLNHKGSFMLVWLSENQRTDIEEPWMAATLFSGRITKTWNATGNNIFDPWWALHTDLRRLWSTVSFHLLLQTHGVQTEEISMSQLPHEATDCYSDRPRCWMSVCLLLSNRVTAMHCTGHIKKSHY